MSSEEHVEELVSCGKDEFSVGQLVSVLKECQALVRPDVDEALANESHDAAASEADWEKFYAIIEKLNAPVISLIEAPELDVSAPSAGTVIAAITFALEVAEQLWTTFKGFDDKKVSDHCSDG